MNPFNRAAAGSFIDFYGPVCCPQLRDQLSRSDPSDFQQLKRAKNAVSSVILPLPSGSFADLFYSHFTAEVRAEFHPRDSKSPVRLVWPALVLFNYLSFSRL